jgi:hypothetical protein
MLQVREPNEQKDGDLKTLKKLLHETFQVVLAAKLTHMSDSKRHLGFLSKRFADIKSISNLI